MKSLYQLAKDAHDVQDACNLIAVVTSYAEALRALRDRLNLGSSDLANHPISRAWADKIASLTGIQAIGMDEACSAHLYVENVLHNEGPNNEP